MLETIREYARERLDGSDEVARIRRSHAEHYLTLAEEMEPHVREEWVRGGGERLDELEREHDNLRAALDWLERHGETDRALRLAAALSEFWIAHNHPEGLRRLEQTLHAEEALTAARAKALNALSLMLFLRGDLETMLVEPAIGTLTPRRRPPRLRRRPRPLRARRTASSRVPTSTS